MNAYRIAAVVLSIAFVSSFAVLAYAAETKSDFVPITPFTITGSDGTQQGIFGGGTTLVDYINTIIRLAIALGAVLAVMRIIQGGYYYMMKDAIKDVKQGKESLQNAITGVLLLMAMYLILYTINPDLVKLELLQQQTDGQGQKP